MINPVTEELDMLQKIFKRTIYKQRDKQVVLGIRKRMSEKLASLDHAILGDYEKIVAIEVTTKQTV